MKTSNPKMHIFKSLSAAQKHYNTINGNANILLCVSQGLGHGEYYVEELTKGEESAFQCWPNHYKLIEQK